ncbi:thiol reductant ABC exporter subunit CydD [Halalkalibacter kiskunsagensis]|uniref:Thiol reductant ABC exporter subunit CydD n=1 Tax=Halalkalibacter kiskunsagensis TaxID=1548599 RepID=A0ABV6K8G0_9BACI
MKSLKKLASEQKGRYYSLFVLAIMLGVLIVLQSYMIVTIVDDLFLAKQTFDQVFPMLLGLMVVLLARVSLSYGNGKIGVAMAANVKAVFRKRLLKSYASQTLSASYKGQLGQKVSVMMDAVDELDSYFSKYVPQRIVSSVVPLIILVVVFSQHLYSGLIILVTAPFIPLFMAIVGGLTQRKSEAQLDSLSAFSGRFLDTLQGLVSLKLYGKSRHYKSVIERSSLDFRDTTMAILKVAFTSSLMLEFISMLSIGLVALELSLRLVVFNEISFFTAFFILLLVPEFFTSLKDLGSAFHAGRSSMGAAVKIEDELKKEDRSASWGANKMPDGPRTIELKNVQFQYDADGFMLKKIQASIKPYSQVAIVGKSGSGKTTLLHVIAGLLPQTSGTILVDGHDRFNYAEHEWFGHISYITQHPYIFAGTIEENIALGVQATKDEIRKAAAKAGIDQMVQSLPNGYATVIGEGGRGLSGGEKQRVALARAFLKHPSVVLFDEPSTGLDLFTEQRLHESMKELSKTSTIITVAHRMQTIKDADHILFLEEGVLLAQGTHEYLKESNPSYRELFSAQREEEK